MAKGKLPQVKRNREPWTCLLLLLAMSVSPQALALPDTRTDAVDKIFAQFAFGAEFHLSPNP